MSKQIFEKWEPFPDLPQMSLEGLYDDQEGFRLFLTGYYVETKILRITFEAELVYRNIDEGDLLKTIHEVKGFPIKWSFFTVKNSEYLKWFHEQSYDIRVSDKITHYAIYTPDDCLDILSLSAYPPKVKWLSPDEPWVQPPHSTPPSTG